MILHLLVLKNSASGLNKKVDVDELIEARPVEGLTDRIGSEDHEKLKVDSFDLERTVDCIDLMNIQLIEGLKN